MRDWYLEKEDHRSDITFSFYRIKGAYYQHDFGNVVADLDHLAEVVIVFFFSPL